MSGPLSGIKVVDLTSVGMGPYATQIMGDMGAKVIKVEAKSGDVFRHAEPKMNPYMSSPYMQLNRNKRSIVLDLKQQDDKDFLMSLLADADCLVSNIRPASMRRLGLDYDSLKDFNSKLICCGVYGYSEQGPYAGRPAFDDVIQSLSGIASLQSTRSENEPSYVNTIFADKVTGITAAYAITMALFERTKSGKGQFVEVPMFETMVSFNLVEHMGGATFNKSGSIPMEYQRVTTKYRKPYKTKDGYVSALPYTTEQWQRLFINVGMDDFANDPKVTDSNVRALHVSELYEILDNVMATRTTAEWLQTFEEIDVPAAPVLSPKDLLDNEHLSATNFFKQYKHDTEGDITLLGIPVSFSRTPGQIRTLPPQLNADGESLRNSKNPWDFE